MGTPQFDLLDSSTSVEICGAFHKLGNLYNYQGKHAMAEKMYRRALDGYEKAWGTHYPSTLGTFKNLHLVDTSRDRHMKVEEICSQALDRNDGVYDTN